jgi:purine-nucleoside/S-methyl-5'-thioadenosine phosphorylase / adenosine deaminase
MCRPLTEIAPHFFTTREWPLGLPAVDAGEDGSEKWGSVAAAIGVEPAQLRRARQVHGTMVVVAGEASAERPEADILISKDPALAVAVQSADCVPILIADRRTGVVAAAHAGWRGLSVRVPAATVAAMARELGSERKDLVAAIGPAIGACCYEVGEDVLQRFIRTGFTSDQIERWFLMGPAPTARNPSMPSVARFPRPAHWYFDAWASARDQLRAVGIPEDQIFGAELCTASHPQWLCSYRRDGSPAGRLAAVIRPRDHAL